MTKTTSLSIVRALLTFLGTFAIGHYFAGHQITGELWTAIGGAVVAVGTTVWAFFDKTTSSEGIQSLIRAAWVSVAGVLSAFGFVKQDTLDSFGGIILSILPVIQSHQARQSALSVASGAAAVDSTGKIVSPPPAAKTSPSLNKVVTMLAGLLCLGTMASAQSPFQAQGPLAAPSVPKTDSVLNAYRFGVAVSPAGVTLAGVYQASAGISFGIQHQNYNYATQVYSVLWSASVVWIPINTATKIQSIKDIATFGALVGFKNNLINVGPFYNPNAPGVFKDKFGLWFTTTINLNN